jgi:DNA polymerase-3 subunit epsilon
MQLTDTPVLLLDIQATGAASAGGILLEVGWCPHPVPSEGRSIQTLLAQVPAMEFPPRLTRLTGLTQDELAAGRPLHEIRHRLFATAGAVATAGTKAGAVCPVVVHYARFEAPYLAQLQSSGQPPADLSFDLICTHEIARRLLPGLPRKGLRAVAGYFGHDTPPLRRCAHHLAATGVIWTALTQRLSEVHKIDTLAELKAWLQATPVPRSGGRSGDRGRLFQVPREALDRLPAGPGVYRLISRSGTPLYVGKAKRLDRRVRAYFQPRRRHAEHILEMLSRAAQLKTTPTCTALEAALLEQDLIKRLAPPYNIALRPDAAELQFWSQDFSTPSPRWDRQTPLGPLPPGISAHLLALLTRALAPEYRIAERELPSLASAEPLLAEIDKHCFVEGLRQFQDHFTPILGRMPPHRALGVIGRQVWRTRYIDPEPANRADINRADVNRVDEAEPQEAASSVGSATADPPWTPERVRRHLEHRVCHSAALLRRSRWLSRLGNATLGWRSEDDGRFRHLALRSGQVVARGDLGALENHPSPPSHAPWRNWRPQDRVTYDRLRVLTTELRRLVQEQRRLSVHLPGGGRGAGTRLNRQRLARILAWF